MKDFFLADKEIQDLINEPKQINCSAHSLKQSMRIKTGRASSHYSGSEKFPALDEKGEWLIYLRQSRENTLDFSCGLGFIPTGRNQTFMLRRYNGKSHPHTNWLDDEQEFYDFHIHQATEKYQSSSYSEEHYAAPTNRYADLDMALKCFFEDCKVTDVSDDSKQMGLF